MLSPLVTYQKWNAIERILHDVKYVYDRVMDSYYYCGDEIYAGEGIGDFIMAETWFTPKRVESPTLWNSQDGGC